MIVIETGFSIESFSISQNIISKIFLYPITQNFRDRMIDSIATYIM